jgi:hypothetical protein
VRVHMRDADSAGLQLANLRHSLGKNLRVGNAAAKRSSCEALNAIAETPGLRERRKLLRIENGFAIDQHDMTADAELRIPLGQLDRFDKSRTVGHQSRGSDDAARMRLHDGAIDSGSKPEIVRIDNEPAQAASLATNRVFEGIFRPRVYSNQRRNATPFISSSNRAKPGRAVSSVG